MLEAPFEASVVTRSNISAGQASSDEWLQTADSTDTVLGDVLTVVLGAEYAVSDTVTIAFSGSALEAGILSSIAVPVTATVSGITLGLLSSDADEARYRITAIDPATPPTTVGAVVPVALAGVLTFDAQKVDAAGTVVVTYSAAISTGDALDTKGGPDPGPCTTATCNTIDYITTGTQFDDDVDPEFDGVIDVDDNRETFEGDVDIDDMTVTTIDNGAADFDESAALVDYDVVVSGDFSFLIDDDPLTPELEPIAGVIALAGCTGGTAAVTVTDVSFTCTNTGGYTLTVDLTDNVSGDPPAPAILNSTAFSVTVDANFTGIGGAATKLILSGSAGAWTLNGFQSFLPYVPYGPGISQVIYLVNRGLKSGDVVVDWVDGNGNTGTLGVIATLGITTTLSIGPTIQAALPAAQSTNGRLGLTVTANVPKNDVQINSQYNGSGNRACIDQDDNLTPPTHP